MKTFLIAAMTCVVAAGVAQAGEAPKSAEASIPFVNHGGIKDWRDDGRDAIYIQDRHGQWYRATFMAPCFDLPFAETIGFETRGPDTFDKFGTVIVRGRQCAVTSLAKSSAPPKKSYGKKKHGIEKASAAEPRS